MATWTRKNPFTSSRVRVHERKMIMRLEVHQGKVKIILFSRVTKCSGLGKFMTNFNMMITLHALFPISMISRHYIVMVNIVSHTLEFVSTLETLRIILWTHTIYQPKLFYSRGSRCGLQPMLGMYSNWHQTPACYQDGSFNLSMCFSKIQNPIK